MNLRLTVIKHQNRRPEPPLERLLEGSGSIGRKEFNDLVLPDPERFISSTHARIEYQGGRYYLLDQSTNGTYLNHAPEPVEKGKPIPLNDGDILGIGDYEIRVTLEEEAQAITDPTPVESAPPPTSEPPPSSPYANAALDPLALIGGADGTPAPQAPPLSTPPTPPQPDTPPLAETPPPAETPLPDLEPRAVEGLEIPDDFDLLADLDPAQPAQPDHAPILQQAFSPPPAAPETPPLDAEETGSTPSGPTAEAESTPEPEPAPAPELQAAQPEPAPAPEPQATEPEPAPAPEPQATEPEPAPAPEFQATEPEPAPTPEFQATEPEPAPAPELQAAQPEPAPAPEPQATEPEPAPAPELQATEPEPAPAPEPQAVQPEPAPAPELQAAQPEPAPVPEPQATEPAPAPEPQTAQPAAAQGQALFDALLEGLGQQPDRPPTPEEQIALARTLGRLVRLAVDGLLNSLAVRNGFKRELRLEMTTIRPVENNPLKFSINAQDALQRMLFLQQAGFMAPEQAIEEAFHDIMAHEMAMVAGLQAALQALLDRFDPQALEEHFKEFGALGSALPLLREAKYWEVFKKTYGQVRQDAEEGFLRLFGEAFNRAYEAQVAELKKTTTSSESRP